MPKIAGVWKFRIVNARITLGEADYDRPALELFILDDEKRLLVPISSKKELYKPGVHLIIDRFDPAFKESGLDNDEDSFIRENEARPEKVAVIRSERGWLTGALAEKYAIWSGRSKDKRVIRGRNPVVAAELPRLFMPWRDDAFGYKSLVKKSAQIKPGHAEYDCKSGLILVDREMWPNWYWWVLAKAQQAWSSELTSTERRQWVNLCRSHERAASELLETWIGIRRRSLDIADANRQAQVAFAEACLMVFEHDEGWRLQKQMEKFVVSSGADIFWMQTE